MTGSAFSLCPTCGHIKPAGVVDCEFCSSAQTKVSLSDLKSKIESAKHAPGENQNLQFEPKNIESEPVPQPSGIAPQPKDPTPQTIPAATAAPPSDQAASGQPTALATSPSKLSKSESPKDAEPATLQ